MQVDFSFQPVAERLCPCVVLPPAVLTVLLGSWGRTDPHLVNPSKSLEKFSTSFFFLYFSLFFFQAPARTGPCLLVLPNSRGMSSGDSADFRHFSKPQSQPVAELQAGPFSSSSSSCGSAGCCGFVYRTAKLWLELGLAPWCWRRQRRSELWEARFGLR